MVYYICGDFMFKELLKKIEEYNTIIIHRHLRPDLDALGSQLGLKSILENKYPNKSIYAVGDESAKFSFLGKMDNISDEIYNDALVIILDVAVAHMVSDDRYKLAIEVFVIDHHKNDCDITNNHICDTSRVACAEYIAYLFINEEFEIPSFAATCLYGGIITDSGRFMYGSALENTFMISSKLIACGANPKYIYDNIYVESLEDREMKNYFSNRFEVRDNVAYLKNTKEVFEKFPKEFNDISRGMLSVMSGIAEIEIWLNFTYDISKDKVIGEFRSRSLPIVDIAKKYGGGGHSLACGATLNDFDEADLVINDFINLLKESKNEG